MKCKKRIIARKNINQESLQWLFSEQGHKLPTSQVEELSTLSIKLGPLRFGLLVEPINLQPKHFKNNTCPYYSRWWKFSPLLRTHTDTSIKSLYSHNFFVCLCEIQIAYLHIFSFSSSVVWEIGHIWTSCFRVPSKRKWCRLKLGGGGGVYWPQTPTCK
jgi:hypothetical protein